MRINNNKQQLAEKKDEKLQKTFLSSSTQSIKSNSQNNSDSFYSNKNPRKIRKIQILDKPQISETSRQKQINPYASIEDIPIIYLSDQEMKSDPIRLFIDLEEKYYKFGAVKVVASPNWKPPFCFGLKDKGITTRIQSLHKLSLGKAFRQNKEFYSYKSYMTKAKQFQNSYQYKSNPFGSTKLLKNQMQFWNIINSLKNGQNKKMTVHVEYAADLQTLIYGSGFPTQQSKKSKDQFFEYHSSLFNLNNLAQSPLSLLNIFKKRSQNISGIVSPWVYMGMLFSTFCWHVQDYWLNSVNYSHKGEIKTWYVISPFDKQKFDQFVKKKTNQNDLLDKITYMIDPLQAIKAGIKVYKINQAPKQFVCTFFKAYHSGFSNGFNVGEAVNFASPKSLGYIMSAIKYYNFKKSNKLLVFPVQWLIYTNRGNSFKQFDELMQIHYKNMIKQEINDIKKIKQTKSFCSSIKIIKQFSDETSYDKIMCSICKQYLYLWTIRCQKCKKYYCKNDLNKCCGDLSLLVRELNQDRKTIKDIFLK